MIYIRQWRIYLKVLELSELSEEEIIVKAREIENKRNKERQEKETQDIVKTLQGKVGKFYEKSTFHDDQKEFYRIHYDSWRESQVKVETWFWYNDNHYGVKESTCYNDSSISDDKEISEHEFMQLVTWWMKQVGVYQVLTMESDH